MSVPTSNGLRPLEDFIGVQITRTQRKIHANKQQSQVHKPPHALQSNHRAGCVLSCVILLDLIQGCVHSLQLILNCDCGCVSASQDASLVQGRKTSKEARRW
jgi:hypothetical protein